VWVVHPLNSEVVDYVSERSDSMMTLCYLGALYASLRAHHASRPQRRVFAAQGHFDEALREFREALAIDPNYAPALEGLRALERGRSH
jgi:hypothetical protein